MIALDASSPVTPPAHGGFVDALRAEVQEYGELLQLFEEHQAAILHRQADALLALDGRVDAQLQLIQARRKERETLAAVIAAEANPPVESTLADLLPLFREALRPLVHALVTEVNQLVSRARRRAQQNRMLLARSTEVTQALLDMLEPGTVTRTYSSRGKMRVKAAATVRRLVERS